MLVQKGKWCTNMEEKIVNIINEMSEYLNIEQLKKLQEVMLKNLSENEASKVDISNWEYVDRFLNAKQNFW